MRWFRMGKFYTIARRPVNDGFGVLQMCRAKGGAQVSHVSTDDQALQQMVVPRELNPLDQFPHLLRAAAVGDQQRVGSIDHDQIFHA